MCFFLEVPRIEESQDPNSSPRRGEVGRPTLRDYGGFLLSVFYRARFQLFTQQFPMFVERLQKLPLRSLTTPLAGFAGGVLVWPHGSPYRIRRPIFTDFYRFFGLSWENTLLHVVIRHACRFFW